MLHPEAGSATLRTMQEDEQDEDGGDTSLNILALLARAEATLIGFPGFAAAPPVPSSVHTSPGVSSRQAIAYARLSDVVGALCAVLTAQIIQPASNDPIHIPRGHRGWWARMGWLLASHQAQDIASQSGDRVARVATLTCAATYVMLAQSEAWEMAVRYGHEHMTSSLSASLSSLSLAVNQLQAQGDGLKACQRMAATTRDLATAAHRSI